MRKAISILSILICLSLVSADDEMVDSSIYKSWINHEIGTSVTRITKMNLGGNLITARTVSTLVAKADNAVSIDDQIVAEINGQKQTQKSERYVSARVKKGKEVMPESLEGEMVNTGNETLTADGKTYECRVFDFNGTSPQGKTTGKFWMHDDIPGMVVKAQISTSSTQGEVNLEVMIESFEIR